MPLTIVVPDPVATNLEISIRRLMGAGVAITVHADIAGQKVATSLPTCKARWGF